MSNEYDNIVQRLQAMEPFTIEKIDMQGNPAPYVQVTKDGLMPDLVVAHHNIDGQIDSIAAQIAWWGRIVAQCRRLWQIHERQYRYWRSVQELALYESLAESSTDAKGNEKISRPTQARVEATYRTLPEYNQHQRKIEAAEEAFNAASAIYEAFREKGNVLRTLVRRAPDGASERWAR